MVHELEDLKKALSEKTLEAEQLAREAAEADIIKSKYLATISHEIRAPLSGIIGLSELMLQDKLNTEHMAWVRLINGSAKNTQSLLSNLLDFSKIESGAMDVESAIFNASELFQEIQHFFTPIFEAQSTTFECTVDDNFQSWRVGDAYKLRQILNNLISNAIKFTNKGRIWLRVTGDDKGISLEVEDTSVGMTNDELGQLFRPYKETGDTTAKYGGTGLGLSICKMFCDLLSGNIQVESDPEKGTCYKVFLPFEACRPHES